MSDKPAHILEIPDSLGRDVDRAREGKIAPPPIEAFLPDSALEDAARATAAAAAPVRAEDLQPISRADAHRRMTGDGEHLPGRPSVRRVIPRPFSRERVTGGRHGKTWQPVAAAAVVPGDMTDLVGKVAEDGVRAQIRYQTVAEVLGIEAGDGSGPAAGRSWDPAESGVSDLEEKVAVGTDVVLTGIGGVTATVDEAKLVRVFR